MISTRSNLSVVLMARSPVLCTTAETSYSGTKYGTCGMTWMASRQSYGTLSASAISCVGWRRWPLTTLTVTSKPCSWNKCKTVVNRFGWLLDEAGSCLPGEYLGLAVMASDELVSSVVLWGPTIRWLWTAMWKLSPWPTRCVGLNVFGIWIQR